MMKIEPLHFSQLKHLARSPAHFRAAVEDPRPPSAAMDLGTLAHRLLLGPRQGDCELAVWTGGRRYGKNWDAFAEEHAHETIVTAKNFHNAKRIAAAVKADETAAEILDGASFEVPLAWEESGFKCETAGIDILKPGVLAELKTTTNTEPTKWMRQCLSMLYSQQCEFYRGAIEQQCQASRDAHAQLGGPVEKVFIIGVEITPPYAVQVLDLTPDLLAWARKSIVLWLERLRVCIADDHWPAYRQRAEVFDVPPWLAEGATLGPDDDEPDAGDDEAA